MAGSQCEFGDESMTYEEIMEALTNMQCNHIGIHVGVLSVTNECDEDDDDSVTDGLSFNRPEVCATCAEEARDSELDSLCGAPLVYATFVAPVQQYSTETEPSRQPSVKQNSSEAEGSNPPPAPPVPPPMSIWCSCCFIRASAISRAASPPSS